MLAKAALAVPAATPAADPGQAKGPGGGAAEPVFGMMRANSPEGRREGIS